MANAEFQTALSGLERELAATPAYGLGSFLMVQVALAVLEVFEDAFQNPSKDPYPQATSCLQEQTRYLRAMRRSLAHVDSSRALVPAVDETLAETKDLFEKAWTIYDSKTYEHSVKLIKDRLLASGFDRLFFEGKRCFDGGCGTGRFAIAMSELGAREVVASDVGDKSIEFAKARAAECGASNIEFIVEDVTALSNHADGSFDFVVSNGVLHHAPETERGIVEHFRITKPGGIYWLYLYGQGGVYWETYDRVGRYVKLVPRDRVRQILMQFGLRLGLVYTFLDNICAPIRKYYSTEGVVEMLKQHGDFSWQHLKGTNPVDDTQLLLQSPFGAELLGPEGEVRIAIQRR